MEFKSLMHIAFYTDQLDQMLDFYVNKLGMTKKSEVNYSIYLDRMIGRLYRRLRVRSLTEFLIFTLRLIRGSLLSFLRPMRLRKSTLSGTSIRSILILPFRWMIFSRRAISFWRAGSRYF